MRNPRLSGQFKFGSIGGARFRGGCPSATLAAQWAQNWALLGGTGGVRVLRGFILHDSASVLGPRVDVGFLELYVVFLRHGGFAMNMGMCSDLSCQLSCFDTTGQCVS